MKYFAITTLTATALGIILGFVFFGELSTDASTKAQLNAPVIAVNIGVVESVDRANNTLITRQLVVGVEQLTQVHITDATRFIERTFVTNENGEIVSQRNENTSFSEVAIGDRLIVSWFQDPNKEQFIATQIEVYGSVRVTTGN